MKEELYKSLLNYYHGTPFKFTSNDKKEIIYGTCDYFLEYCLFGEDENNKPIDIEYPFEVGKLELILRHPCDINATQKQKNRELCHKVKDVKGNAIYYADTPASLHYCITNSVDMFEMIEQGYAVDLIELPKELRVWAARKMYEKANKLFKSEIIV